MAGASSPLDSLTETQKSAFAELKTICKEESLQWPRSELDEDSAHASNDDIALLRYLRARSYDPQAAYKQYAATAAWRRQYRLDQVYDNADIDKFETMRRLQPSWTGRRSKDGIPLYVYVLEDIKPTDLALIAKEDPELSSIFLPAEYITHFVQPLCAAVHPQGIVYQSFNIIDLTNVGLRGFWSLRNILQKASTMATAHYPETVARIFVVGAPSFFPMIWKLVTRWFDPATTRKIIIVSTSEITATLSEAIAPSNLPERYGGELKWKFGDHPILDNETAALGGHLNTEWREGPIRIVRKGERREIVAVGKVGDSTRRETLAALTGEDTLTNGMQVVNGDVNGTEI